MTSSLTRRQALTGGGALIFAFRFGGAAQAQTETGTGNTLPLGLAGDLNIAPMLDSWIRIDSSGAITILTGKAELGQGIKTALLQVAAEELKTSVAVLTLVTADTALTANEGYTAASHSVQDSGSAIRNAAAQVREILLSEAARRWSVDPTTLWATHATITDGAGRSVGYGELVRDGMLHSQAQVSAKLTPASEFTVMNHSVPRIDIPAKVTGGSAYVHDLRPSGMLHARVLRPPSYGAVLASLDTHGIADMPGGVQIVRDASFVAVVAVQEWTAIQALRRLSTRAVWRESARLPNSSQLADALMALPSKDTTILERGAQKGDLVEALFSRPYTSHGSIGPSCALAKDQDGVMTIWTHTQGVFPLRNAIADMLGREKDKVRCIHAEGAGCYGHNGADDVAADAALIARALPGRPVRVQWMREQEHAWEPFGPGMAVKVAARLDRDGAVADWRHEVWSQSHMMRPGPAGTLLAARDKSAPAAAPPPVELLQPEGGGDRNAIPLYAFSNARVIHHFLPDMPLRGSSMRSLGGYLNVFAIESTMDDLARSSGQDPVAFRLRHLDDQRARDVVEMAATSYGWELRAKSPGVGHGFAFARYKNLEAYCAIAMEIFVAPGTGVVSIRRVVAAVDTGEIINPDGVRNQVEGGILQSASWTLFEEVTFDPMRITSVDWASYPIMRFSEVPQQVDVVLVDRPGAPFLGAGETAQGPTGAAVANAIADATGRRLRQLPLLPDRILGRA
jgi:nicotinate dehydrogenase subunit B